MDNDRLSIVSQKPMRPGSWRCGYSIVEMLVAISIIGILLSLLLPAVQEAREAARRVQCSNQLRQLGLATQNYLSAHGRLPPAFCVNRWQLAREDGESWSVHARLLPFLEQDNASQKVKLDVDWHFQVESGVTSTVFPGWVCPSEVRPEIRLKNGQPYVAPTNYGFNGGTWHIFSPISGRTGDGAFVVNGRLSDRDFVDGMSNTLAAAEVKTYQPYVRNTGQLIQGVPDRIDAFQGIAGQFKTTGHTVWPDGRIHHTGVTTTFAPNRKIPYVHNNELYDIDYSSQQEGNSASLPTQAAVTSRSYHEGVVGILLMDSSVRFLSDGIDLTTYRALGTRTGGEVVTLE